MRVAIVGAGIMGASAALQLAERGHDVVLFEQFAIGHDRGSSHGHSRIIRKAYPDAFYTAIMEEAYPMWSELQFRTREQIVFEPGLLYFGSFESVNVRDVLQSLQQLEVPHEVMDDSQVRRAYPRIRLEPGEIGIFTPEAGWVDAERALAATTRLFEDAGGVVLENQRADIEKIDEDFDRFIVAPGAWIADYVSVPVRVTLQTYGYVAAEPLEGPVWIEDCEKLFYGFPSEPEKRAFKIGVHVAGRTIDLEDSDRSPSAEHVEAIREQASRRFGIEKPEVQAHGCLYTTTVDEDFLLGRIGENGFFASACSGHGFKFGPWIGKTLADFVEEKDDPENHPRFCWPKPLLEA